MTGRGTRISLAVWSALVIDAPMRTLMLVGAFPKAQCAAVATMRGEISSPVQTSATIGPRMSSTATTPACAVSGEPPSTAR